MKVERGVAHFLWAWLVRRGWVVCLNPPELCSNLVEREDGSSVDTGWRPLHSVRHGRTPVYRGPASARWIEPKTREKT